MLANNQKLNIICLSNQLWDYPGWTNKKHVMTRLAKQGHKVLFVDPPINTGNVFFTQIKRGFWPIARLLTQKRSDPTGALVYTPLNTIPKTETTSKWHVERIRKLAKGYFVRGRKTVLWVYHVQVANLEKYVEGLDYDILIYDCVDNYEGFPSNSSFYSTIVPKEKVLTQERYLAGKATAVFATAPGLVEKFKGFNKKVYFTPNVGDYEKYKNARSLKNKIPEDLQNIKRPRIGFTGSMDEYKFDAKLMRKIAEDHPEYSFVLIGQIAMKDADADIDSLGLGGLTNVHFLGFKPYATLENYFGGFDAYIIPYQLNDYTVGGCFPVKFHDALAAGLPTVVTDLPAYIPFENVSYISRNYEEFSANVNRAVEEDNERWVSQRQEVAKDNSWEGKVEKMLDIIYGLL
jgi:glycosyltransferase involved in cell wall biosynthesis